jgi:hypothetical protein
MSPPENVTENFSASFQEKQFQANEIYNIYCIVNKLKTTGSLLDKKPDRKQTADRRDIGA